MRRLATRVRQALATSLLVAAGACAGSGTTGPARAVTAVAQPDGIALANHGDERACYFAISHNAIAYTEFVLADCEATVTTSVLAPGERRTLPWSSIVAQPADSDFVVWWWTGRLAAPGALRGTGRSGAILVTR